MSESTDKSIPLNVRLQTSESTAHPRAANYSRVGVVQGRWHRVTVSPSHAYWKTGLMLGLLLCGWLWVAGADAAQGDEVTPISAITVNPLANNRRVVILHGKTRGLSTYHGQDGFGQTVCGQGFILEDDTGSLDVLYLFRCHATETPTVIAEGERVIVYATIDVSPEKMKNSEGKEMLIKAMATKIVREK